MDLAVVEKYQKWEREKERKNVLALVLDSDQYRQLTRCVCTLRNVISFTVLF